MLLHAIQPENITTANANQDLSPSLKQENSTAEVVNNTTILKRFNCLINDSLEESPAFKVSKLFNYFKYLL